MAKLKILQLQNGPHDSTATVGRQLAQCLTDGHARVTTVYLSGTATTAASPEHTVELGLHDLTLKGVGRWWAILKLLQRCKMHDFDVLIAHRFKPLHILLTVGQILKRPVLGIVHGEGEFKRPYRQRMIRSAVKRSNCAFVAVSDSVRSYLLSLNCGFNSENTRTICNAINANELDKNLLPREQARHELGLGLDRFVLGTIGRLVPVKGHHDLVNAFSRISGRFPQADLAIIGEGREQAALTERIQALGLEQRVHLLGAYPQAALYLGAFDAFALPSYSEGLPLALLEAMAARLPIVASSIDAIASVAGKHALLHPAGDCDALASSIEQILAKSAEQRQAIGQALREHLEDHFGIEAFAAAYRQLIEQLCQQVPSQ